MGSKGILIVDDHAVVRLGLKSMIDAEPDLEVFGMAASVGEALNLAESGKPDLVVSDLSLSDRSGLELIKDLQCLHSDVPVLVISMHDEIFYAERALKAGARGYLMKENSEFLIPAIRRILDGEPYLSPAMTNHLLEGLSNQDRARFSFPLKRLSDRELEVFELIGEGIPTSEIGERLCISPRTVDAHRNKVREKLGLSDSNAVLRYAVRWVEGERINDQGRDR